MENDMEKTAQERAQWLSDYGVRERDVMWEEEDGREYIYLITEGQDDDGRVEISKKKVYLPDNIQTK